MAEGDREAVARPLALLLSGQKELIESKLTPEKAMWVDLILRQIGRKGVREVTGKAPSAAQPEAEPVPGLDAVEHSHVSAACPNSSVCTLGTPLNLIEHLVLWALTRPKFVAPRLV